MKTLFFVGIHNKPGMEPLDVKTQTGKIIRTIEIQLGLDGVKTNLHGTTFLPEAMNEIYFDACLWHDVYKPKSGDLIVLLGKAVQKYFLRKNCKIISIDHPGSVLYSGGKRKTYIENAVKLIQTALCQ